jgi:GT2 family glycosyltransferase
MKYSIIIPVYCNKEDHIQVVKNTVDSIRANSEDYELIIIDDYGEYNAAFANADVLIQQEKNSGIAPAWNAGLKAAKGEFLVVVNDDITVQKGWLDKLRQALEFDDTYMVSAPGVEGKINGTGIEENRFWFPGYCFMLTRKTLETIGYFDEQFTPFNYEDTDYWTRVFMAGGKLVRNYSATIQHLEGSVLHTLKYEEVSENNKKKFIDKWGFDPIPVFYYGAPGPWEK